MNKLNQILNRKIVVRQSMVDIIFGGFIFLLNLFLATIGISKYIGEGYGNKYGVTPQTFPRVIFIAAMVLAALMILKGVLQVRKKNEKDRSVPSDQSGHLSGHGILRLYHETFGISDCEFHHDDRDVLAFRRKELAEGDPDSRDLYDGVDTVFPYLSEDLHSHGALRRADPLRRERWVH